MKFTSLANLIRTRSGEMGDRPALADRDRRISWSDLDGLSNRVAQALIGSGVRPGDRVGILDKNSIEFFEVMFGASKANVVPVPLNWRLSVGELASVIENADLSVVIASAEFSDQLVQASTAVARRPEIVVIGRDEESEEYEDYVTWRDARSSTDPLIEFDPDVATVILYTSGTTSLPKGAVLHPTVFDTLLEPNATTWGYLPDSVSLMVLPGFHAGGTVWSLVAMWRGALTVTMRDADPNAILDAIEQHGVTHMALVPTLVQAMLDSPHAATADLSTLQFLAYGASPMPGKLLERVIDKLPCRISQMYGVTETAGGVFELDADDHVRDQIGSPRLQSAGRALPWVRYRIVDTATSTDVPVGQIGEIWLRSGQTMTGYWRNPEATAARIVEDGWVTTGDLGYADGDGYVYLKSRLQDLIITGGENVYPAEVESVIRSHPDVIDVAVTGIEDARWVEAVAAAVVPRQGSTLTAETLQNYVRQSLAGYKTPRQIAFVDALPVNGMGKVLRQRVRELIQDYAPEERDESPGRSIG